MEHASSSPSRLEDRIGALEIQSLGLMIGDGALEAATNSRPGPPYTLPHPVGPCVGDGALEAAAGSLDHYTFGGCPPPVGRTVLPQFCR